MSSKILTSHKVQLDVDLHVSQRYNFLCLIITTTTHLTKKAEESQTVQFLNENHKKHRAWPEQDSKTTNYKKTNQRKGQKSIDLL